MGIFDFFNKKGISNRDIFIYIVIFVILLFFFDGIIEVKLSHILTLIVFFVISYLLFLTNNEDINDFNKEMEYKLLSLSPNTQDIDYMYLDVDLIELFHNIKINYFKYNKKSYINSLKSANNVLKIRNDIEKDICVYPEIEYSIEFLPKKEKKEPICGKILNNAYQNYQVAEEQMKLSLNYLHSLLIKIPSDYTADTNFSNITTRAHILLKRNLDIMYNRINNAKIQDKYVQDYDLTRPFNSDKEIVSSFNLF